jgi:hypothetical protein
MPLLQVVMTLIVVGVLLWLVNRFIPMASVKGGVKLDRWGGVKVDQRSS